jgi:hypothetical protein
MNTFHILALCGIGDILSHITRFPAVNVKYPDHKIKMWIGGFGRSPQFMKEIVELENDLHDNIEVSLIKNLTFHNQLPEMRKFLNDNVVHPGDILEDWSFCEEIFQNKEPIFMQYEMTDGFDYEYTDRTEEFVTDLVFLFGHVTEPIIAIQPLTKSGNAEGFESDVERGRFWSQEHWQKICDKLHEDDMTIFLSGYGDEDWELFDYCNSKDYDVISGLGWTIAQTFDALASCDGNIACNSWTWEITSRLNIPTVCFFTKNHFFIQNHLSDNPNHNINSTTYLETNPQAEPDDVYNVWKYMFDNDGKPRVNYSVCMITLDDEDCVEETINNVYPNLNDNNEFIIVDGGSKDETKHILYASESILPDSQKIFENEWNDNFEIQKNFALDKASNEWRVWIDADETYEPIFWNQLPWYIWLAEKNDVDCIIVPRINTIEGLTQEQLNEYAQRNGWQISGFNWINYPDAQQRIFKSNCRFVGRTHERITGSTKSSFIAGVHCIHPKTKVRQERGFERENKQYEIEAEKVYERVMKDE